MAEALLGSAALKFPMYAPSRRGRDGSIVVGIGGISGSGKSTIAHALARKAREYGYSSECIGMDDFFSSEKQPLPADTREKLAASAHACIREKAFDTNSPAAVDWQRFLSAISSKRSGPAAPDILFVEGFLVFCREGSEALATGTTVYDAAVFVSVSQHVAMERKRARSYPQVPPKDFELYFDVVTYANYARYGRARPAAVPLFSFPNDVALPSVGRIDDLLRKLLPVVVCVGDLHGWLDRAVSLFANLRTALPDHQFNTADVVFLGDYVDRGPQSNQTIEWLIALPSAYPRQRHFFLAGNHELALIAALGDLPPPHDGFASWASSKSDYHVWDGPGSENIHWQGRRYLSRPHDIYSSTETMSSYGIDTKSIIQAHGGHAPAMLQQALQLNVPRSHREFLIACDWVIEFPARGQWLPRLTFVHAGLTGGPLESQLACLRAKDCRDTRITQLSGREEVLDAPVEIIASGGMLISGHHGPGFLQVRAHRAIIDESGGAIGQRLAAMLLPLSDQPSAESTGHTSAATYLQPEPTYVYDTEFVVGLDKFWNLDAMWEAAYVRLRHDASFEVVTHVRDLAKAGEISEVQMRHWVNRQSDNSGYTLLHQVAWHCGYGKHDIRVRTLLEMGADQNITAYGTKETAKDVASKRQTQKT